MNKKLFIVFSFVLVFSLFGLGYYLYSNSGPNNSFKSLSNNPQINDIENEGGLVAGIKDFTPKSTIFSHSAVDAEPQDTAVSDDKHVENIDKEEIGANKNDEGDSNKDSGDSDKDNNISTTPNPTPLPTPTATPTSADLLGQKIDFISSSVSSHSSTNLQSLEIGGFSDLEIKQIFLPDLVDFFGANDLAKVFESVTKIEFVNTTITGQEATADALVYENNLINSYKAYFFFKEGSWYLYKTEGF